MSAAEISQQLSSTSHVKVSRQTVSRRLSDYGLLAPESDLKPFISKKQTESTPRFCQQYK